MYIVCNTITGTLWSTDLIKFKRINRQLLVKKFFQILLAKEEYEVAPSRINHISYQQLSSQHRIKWRAEFYCNAVTA